MEPFYLLHIYIHINTYIRLGLLHISCDNIRNIVKTRRTIGIHRQQRLPN